MLWPVLLTTHPRETPWSVGERVATRLRWLDAPALPDDLVLRHVGVRASPLLDAGGEPWAQLVEAGGLRAVRDGHHASGDLTLDGCPGFDAFLGIIGQLPVTVGTVRRVRLLQELHERGNDGWIPRPGALRLIDVPDASPRRLCDDPSLEADPGTMVILSPEQYFRSAYDQLPAEQWQAQGFLVDLDVRD